MTSWLVEQLIAAIMAMIAGFFHSIGLAGLAVVIAGAMLAASLSKRAMAFFMQPRGMAVSAAIVAIGLLWAWWTWPAPASLEPSPGGGTSAPSITRPEGQLEQRQAASKPEIAPTLSKTSSTPTARPGQMMPMGPTPFMGGPVVTVVPQFSGRGMVQVPSPIEEAPSPHGHMGGGFGGGHHETVTHEAGAAEHVHGSVPGPPGHGAVPPKPPEPEEEAPPPPQHRNHPAASTPPAPEPEPSPPEPPALSAKQLKAIRRNQALNQMAGLQPNGQPWPEGGMNGGMTQGHPAQRQRGGMNTPQRGGRGMMPQGGMHPGFEPMHGGGMGGRMGRRR